jgi:hypothetical protein
MPALLPVLGRGFDPTSPEHLFLAPGDYVPGKELGVTANLKTFRFLFARAKIFHNHDSVQ